MPKSSSTPSPDQRSNAEIADDLAEVAKWLAARDYPWAVNRCREAARALVASPQQLGDDPEDVWDYGVGRGSAPIPDDVAARLKKVASPGVGTSQSCEVEIEAARRMVSAADRRKPIMYDTEECLAIAWALLSRSCGGFVSDCTQPVMPKGNSGNAQERDTVPVASPGPGVDENGPLAAALVSLVADNIPPDIQEVLTVGNPSSGIKPHALKRALLSVAALHRPSPPAAAESKDRNDE